MNDYSVHLLCYGKGADMMYISADQPQRPGTAFTHPAHLTDRDILLAGGFPTLHPDSRIPLSPTLQLNADLTDIQETELAAIGRAELIRCNSQSFRSYTLDPDPGITVLGTAADAVHGFVDRYGGVLRIDPLLVGGSDPELTTARDLEILSDEDGHLLSFLVRQPIIPEKCTYCGACGSVCPEHCLSEQLYLDFSRCTGCGECVTGCPHDAIDLDGMEKRTLRTPAVLLLEGVETDLPAGRSGIYREEDLGRFFESIYGAWIDEALAWNRSVCQYSVKLKTCCDRCFRACTLGAVSRDRDGIHIDHRKCTECGACLAACPTGALQYARFDDTAFIEYFRTVELHPDMTVVLGSEQELHRFWWRTGDVRFSRTLFLEHPQPRALSAMHLFLLYAMGATRVVILQQSPGPDEAVPLQTELGNGVIEALYSRRPILFSDPDQLEKLLGEDADPNPLPVRYRDFSHTNRREKLADLLSFLLEHSVTEPSRLTGPATESFGTITCSTEKCTLCSGCVGECRIGALTADSRTFSLNHAPALCVQCGVCVELCPEDALALQPGLSLHGDFFDETLLARAEPVQCLGCGKIFGTRQSLARVMALLTEKNLLEKEDDLLNYCETCRVVQLFEMQRSKDPG